MPVRHLRTRDGVGMPHARSGGDALRRLGKGMWVLFSCLVGHLYFIGVWYGEDQRTNIADIC